MSLVKSIYDAIPIEVIFDEDNSTTTVVILYNNNYYIGTARCHLNDKAFCSKRIGERIALSRARIEIMEAERHKIQKEVCWKNRIYLEVTNHRVTNYDGSIKFPELYKNYTKAKKRLKTITKAIKKEKISLDNYLRGFDRVIKSVSEKRKRDKNN